MHPRVDLVLLAALPLHIAFGGLIVLQGEANRE